MKIEIEVKQKSATVKIDGKEFAIAHRAGHTQMRPSPDEETLGGFTASAILSLVANIQGSLDDIADCWDASDETWKPLPEKLADSVWHRMI